MYLKFESDSSVSTAGFQIQFEQGKSNVYLFMIKLMYSTKLVAHKFHSKQNLSFKLVSSSSGGQEQSSGALDPCASELPVVLSGSSSGTIQSPNYPSDYPNDADCNWVVEVGGGVVVELTIVTFDVEDG